MRPRRFLIAPDKFKGSLDARGAAAAMAEGVRRAEPDAEIDLCPISDGGEGFAETVRTALGGRWVSCPAVDALGRGIESRYLLVETPEGPAAVIGMAETAGIWRLARDERDPTRTGTHGVGILMRDAVERHAAARILLGIGGSATNDGGCGMAAALGVRFLDAEGAELDPLPVHLARLDRVDAFRRIPLPPVTAACDVENPLLGQNGATAVFSGQKGATDEDKLLLEAALFLLAAISGGGAAAATPGAGAAGGLGFGLLHFAGADLVPGFALLADLLDLPGRIRAADLVLTGEGSLDAQSLGGKGPVALARMARQEGTAIGAFCGATDGDPRLGKLFDFVETLESCGHPAEVLMDRAAELLADLTARTLPPR